MQILCNFPGSTRLGAVPGLVGYFEDPSWFAIKEQQQGWDNKNWPRDKAFIRRGEVGSYKDEIKSRHASA